MTKIRESCLSRSLIMLGVTCTLKMVGPVHFGYQSRTRKNLGKYLDLHNIGNLGRDKRRMCE